MKEKFNLYGGFVVLFIIIILCCSFYKLIYPDNMMKTCDYIFDSYNTSGMIWTFWKMVGGVTRLMAFVTVSVTILAMVGIFCRFVGSRKLVWGSIVLNALNVIWLFGLTLAEKNENILRFFIKIFSFICQVEYNPKANLAAATNKLDYFGNRGFVLCIIVLLLVVCVIWMLKKEIKENVYVGYGKLVLYILIVGIIHQFIDFCTESHVMYSFLGIPKEDWEYLFYVRGLKTGFGLFFYIPVILLVITVLNLLLYHKLAKGKMMLISTGLLLVNLGMVMFGMLNNINESAEYAINNNALFYAVSLKKVMVSECIGLFLLEFVAMVILINLLPQKSSCKKESNINGK